MSPMPVRPAELTLRGRDAEVARLDDAVNRALAGRLAIVMVEGESGIGKTRLLSEALRAAPDQGFQTARAKGEEMEQTRPFGLIAEALGCTRSASDPRRAEIAALLASHDTGDHGPITVSSDPGLRFRAVDALCDLVESLVRERPLMIGVDDLQWADPSSLLVLATLCRTAAGLPVAVIGCYRSFPQPPGLRGLLDSLHDNEVLHMRLGRLSDRAVQDIVSDVVGAAPGTELLAEVAGAAGNPMFVTELLNAIVEAGHLHSRDGHAEVTSTSTSSPSLRLTILRRLSALPEDALQILRTGSLLGSSFSTTELSSIMARPATELLPALEAIMAAGVLDEDGVKLRFRHDLIREAVYEDVPSSLRIALHREAGQRLAEIGAPATRIAEQFTRGAETGDDEAIGWLTMAARDAMSSSPETGGEFLERAVKLMTPADPRRDLLLTERADALMLEGRVSEAITAARSLLGRDHNPDVDLPVRTLLGRALLVNGRPVEALRELSAAVDSPRSTETQRAACLRVMSSAHLWVGDFSAATETATLAQKVARELDDQGIVTGALATESVVACMLGQMSKAIGLSDTAISLRDVRSKRRSHDFTAFASRGWILMELDRAADAVEALDRGRRICEEFGVRWALATYQAYLAVVRFVAGEWDDVMAELEAGIEFAEEAGITHALKPAYSAQALVRFHRNDLEGARQALDNAAIFADRGSRLFEYRLLWPHALLLEAEGEATAALEEMSGQWRICQDAGMAVDYPTVGPDLVRLACAAGDVDLATEVATAVAEVAATNDVPSFTGAALRCEALLSGDADVMRRAIAAYAKGPRELERGLACVEAADQSAARGDAESARSLLLDANGIFEKLDATRDLARVDADLRRLGVRRGRDGHRQRPQFGWESLTPTERAVADLVAEGLSNPQIGDRQYVSRRTVQTHVAHIFTKLGIGSRAQLAAEVAVRRSAAHG
jgi:DNA-binding CsgD family transcriptional regulator/tetratricopeptide (TPR) repeat protein